MSRTIRRPLPLLLLAGLAACVRPNVAHDEPAAPLLATFAGDVVGPFGAFVDGAAVRLEWIDPASGTAVLLAEQTTDRFNGYRFSSRRAGRHRLAASAPRCRPASSEFEIDRDAELEHRFFLEADREVVIAGRLVDPFGAPLSVAALALLFPEALGHDPAGVAPGGDGVAEAFPLTGASGLVARYGPPDRPIGAFDARLSVEGAAFEIPVPGGFAGVVELTFRGATITRQGWRDGDGELVVGVDVDRLRASLGVLALDVVAADGAALSNVRVNLSRRGPIETGATLIDRVLLRDVGPMLRAVGVPAGDVTVVVGAAGRATRLANATVPGSGAAMLPVVLPPPVSLRVRLLGVTAAAAELVAERVEVRTASGESIPAPRRLEWVGGTAELVLRDAPVGDVVLASGVNVFALRIDAAAPSAVDWTIEPEYEAYLPVQFPARRDDPRAESRVVVVRLERRDGTLVSEAAYAVTFDGNGAAQVPVRFTPGRYWITSAIVDLGREGWDRQDVVLRETDDGMVLLFDGEFEGR